MKSFLLNVVYVEVGCGVGEVGGVDIELILLFIFNIGFINFLLLKEVD